MNRHVIVTYSACSGRYDAILILSRSFLINYHSSDNLFGTTSALSLLMVLGFFYDIFTN